jgi:putative ribosome biogenesis GTPase RsgA
MHEPDCGVIKALEDGLILPDRYESYLRILSDILAKQPAR